VDMMFGTGGTPEGVLAACAIKALGGEILAQFDPQSDSERKNVLDFGLDLNQVLTTDTLIRDDNVFFAATGISGGTFLGGVSYSGTGATTHSLVLRGKTGTIRRITSTHQWDKLMRFSSIKY
ncbi:MAG: fructose-bisphosphatase class II, partial [Proteobacteria bacterium]|nr:fructose-bisphosphatase class II [Pseudomonadota bacterium]